MNKFQKFMESAPAVGSFHWQLQQFLFFQEENGIADTTNQRLFWNLHPLGLSLGNRPPVDVNRREIKQYIERRWLTLAPDTMRTTVSDIRQFFKWLRLENKVRGIKAPRPRRRRTRNKAADEKDIHQLMTALSDPLRSEYIYRDLFGILQCSNEEWPPAAVQLLRDLLILTFLYETGARAGELAKLGSKAMTIATRRPSAAYLVTMIGKTDDRDRLFTEKTAELWRIWQIVRPDGYNDYAVTGWKKGRDPRPMLANGISQMLVRRCEQFGIKVFRAQSLRHSKAKRARQLLGLELASLLLDHSNLRTTETYYSNIDEAELIDAAARTGLQYDLWFRTLR